MTRGLTLFSSSWSVLLVAASLLIGVTAQSSDAQCLAPWAWAFNSKQQSPCLVAAYLDGACNGGEYNIDALPEGHHYVGPTQAIANPCQCSTVLYSLVSACGSCQNRTTLSWSSWSTNCSTIFNSQFTEQIPSGTAVPHWAYLDVVTTDDFNANAAQAAGDGPESTGTASQSTGSAGSSSTGASNPTPTPSSGSDNGSTSSSSHKSNAGPIAGGVVGGVVGLALIGGLIAFFLIRRRRSHTPASAAYMHPQSTGAGTLDGKSPPPTSYSQFSDSRPFSPDGPMMSPPMSQPRLYNPSDPSTFPSPAPEPTLHTTNSDYTSSLGFNPHAGPGVPRGQYSGAPEV